MAFSSLLRCRQGVSASPAPSALITVVTILRSSFYPALESLVTGERWRLESSNTLAPSPHLWLSQSLPDPIYNLSLWCHWHYKPPRPDGAVHVLSAFHSRIVRRRAEVWMLSGLVSERVMMAALCWILIQTGGHSTVSLPSLSGESQQNMRQFSSSLLT